jgi:hypothetical protein
LRWFIVLLNKQLKQTSLIQQPRLTDKKQHFQRSTQKVFVGPHFWLTEHYSNRVTKSWGVTVPNGTVIYINTAATSSRSDRHPNSVWGLTHLDRITPFESSVCVGPLEMPLFRIDFTKICSHLDHWNHPELCVVSMGDTSPTYL